MSSKENSARKIVPTVTPPSPEQSPLTGKSSSQEDLSFYIDSKLKGAVIGSSGASRVVAVTQIQHGIVEFDSADALGPLDNCEIQIPALLKQANVKSPLPLKIIDSQKVSPQSYKIKAEIVGLSEKSQEKLLNLAHKNPLLKEQDKFWHEY
jgi:hypothetical protein